MILPAALIARADSHTEAAPRPSHPSKVTDLNRQDEGDADHLSPMLERVIELTNRVRLKVGLPALKRQRNLNTSASWLARDMAARRYFDHHDSTGRGMPERISAFKYDEYSALGENIAMGQRTPDEVVDGWMNSPGHRANILSRNFSEIGVGYVPASGHGAAGYWVQDFGARFDQCPIVIDTDCSVTASSQVKLSIHGGDSVQRMRFSNDGARWTGWEEFRPLRDWVLEAGTGKRTVFIEIMQDDHVQRIAAAVTVETPPHSTATASLTRSR